jgi:hypothetical protein
MQGLGVLYMKNAEEYIDQVFHSASKSLNAFGLQYVGYERCTPQEEYEEVTKARNNKRIFDIAKSDVYMVKYLFTFQGIPLPPRFIYLPYVNEGGIFSLGGSQYHITPVMSDKVISPGDNSVFVRLLRDKIIFRRLPYTLIVDDVRETRHVVWAQIYRKPTENTKVPATTKANTCIAHYLFAKYGFRQAFIKFAGFDPIVGKDEINTTTYTSDEYVICKSSQIKPKTFIGDFYVPTEIRIAIPKTHWNELTKALVVGLFYVIDHFPSRFEPEHLDNNTMLWMLLLGEIVFSARYSHSKLYSSIEEHFASLDDYVDTINVIKLRENGYHVKDFYDLLSLILDKFATFVNNNEHASMNMFGKSLEVLYYMLYDITASIFKVNFRLSKLASKKPLTEKDIIETFNTNMKPGVVYSLSSGKIIAESVSYSGDHMYPKITSKITEQEGGAGGMRGQRTRTVVDEDKRLDISMIEGGSVLFLSKSNPTPVGKINPYMSIDIKTGTILPNPKFDELREKTRKLLTGLHTKHNPLLITDHETPDLDHDFDA